MARSVDNAERGARGHLQKKTARVIRVASILAFVIGVTIIAVAMVKF